MKDNYKKIKISLFVKKLEINLNKFLFFSLITRVFFHQQNFIPVTQFFFDANASEYIRILGL